MKKKKFITIPLIILALLFILAGICVWYVGDYYHVTDKDAALADTAAVKVSAADFGYVFDGPGEDSALIFYPGAKVEDLAYADLLKRLASEGVDCFLVHMPCNLALLGADKADIVMNAYSYEHWYIAGHSLGGTMAANYAHKNSEKLDGLIFLASYSTEDLSDTDLEILSVYGSEDKVVKMEKIEQGRGLMPSAYEEFCIEGGNHANFGDYGKQSGDGDAAITGAEQKAQTVRRIAEMIL